MPTPVTQLALVFAAFGAFVAVLGFRVARRCARREVTKAQFREAWRDAMEGNTIGWDEFWNEIDNEEAP